MVARNMSNLNIDAINENKETQAEIGKDKEKKSGVATYTRTVLKLVYAQQNAPLAQPGPAFLRCVTYGPPVLLHKYDMQSRFGRNCCVDRRSIINILFNSSVLLFASIVVSCIDILRSMYVPRQKHHPQLRSPAVVTEAAGGVAPRLSPANVFPLATRGSWWMLTGKNSSCPPPGGPPPAPCLIASGVIPR